MGFSRPPAIASLVWVLIGMLLPDEFSLIGADLLFFPKGIKSAHQFL